MKVLTYTRYKEHCELYTEIHDSMAVNSCHVGLFKKGKILLEDNKFFKYSYSKASSLAVFNLDDYIEFTLSSGTYSIDEFNKIQGSSFTTKTKLERASHQKIKAGRARKRCIHCRQ